LYKQFFKRLIDIVLSLVGLIVLLPVMLIIAIAIKIDNPGPVFFRQKRVSIHKTYFVIRKYRTMRIDTPSETPTHLLVNPEKWISRTGRVLRKYSLDELPNIFSILVSKMSIIGPRPALWNQDDLIAERDKYGANDVRPGLTGWAQINGRDELPIEAKARLDGEYVERMSFLFDCKCFFGTILKVVKREGVVEGSMEQGENDVSAKEQQEVVLK
jgi:O-antigen biosynthesis protein WbqP